MVAILSAPDQIHLARVRGSERRSVCGETYRTLCQGSGSPILSHALYWCLDCCLPSEMDTRTASDAGGEGQAVPPSNPSTNNPASPSGESTEHKRGSSAQQPSATTRNNSTPAPPPASTIVVNAERTEREVQLQAELDSERGAHETTAKQKKERELRIAELEDELHKLRSTPQAEAKPKRSFLDVSEFFED